MKYCDYSQWVIFTTLHFLCNLWMSPISWNICLRQAFSACCNVTFKLSGSWISYKDYETLWLLTLRSYLQHFIFFITYKRDILFGLFILRKPLQFGVMWAHSWFTKRVNFYEHSNLLRKLVTYGHKKFHNIGPSWGLSFFAL